MLIDALLSGMLILSKPACTCRHIRTMAHHPAVRGARGPAATQLLKVTLNRGVLLAAKHTLLA